MGAVIRLGLIAETQQDAQTQQTQQPAGIVFTIPIKTGDGEVENMEVNPETVAEAVSVLQMTADDAAKHIANMIDTTALIVIDACDSRKTVKNAAAGRAVALEADGAEAGE